MATINRFEEIEAWQTARELTRCVYDLTNQGSFARDFGLRDQIRRASVSAMSNVAEGFESRTNALFKDYLGRAKASAGEVRSQTYVALDAGYFTQDQFRQVFSLAEQCSRQISRFINYLDTNPNVRPIREDSADYDVFQTFKPENL